MKLQEMKTTILEIKTTLKLIDSRLAVTEEKIRESGQIPININYQKWKTAKRLKNIEQSISELWDNFKQYNTYLFVVSEAGKWDGKGGIRNIWRHNNSKFSKSDGNYKPTYQEAQQISNSRNMKKPITLHSNSLIAEKLLKATRGKNTQYLQRKYTDYCKFIIGNNVR